MLESRSNFAMLLIKSLLLAIVIVQYGCSAKTTPTSEDGQAKCTLKLPAAPYLRGLRLGMDLQEVRASLPEISSRAPDEFGWTGYHVITQRSMWSSTNNRHIEVSIADRKEFQGVTGIRLELVDGRVSC